MTADGFDERLNALVDGELSAAESVALLERMAGDAELRERVAQLRLTKDLVRQAYAGVVSPPVATPRATAGPGRRHAVAAALFGAGLLLGGLVREPAVERPGPVLQIADAAVASAESGRLVLHLGSAGPDKALATLERAEGLIQAARDAGRPLHVEIVANGPGLDLLRVGASGYGARIESMRRAYPELALVACGQTVQKLRDAGAEVRLFPGTVTASSALDQIVLRMQQGWVYVRI